MQAQNQWAFVAVSEKAEGYTIENGIYVPTSPDELYVHGVVVNASEAFPAKEKDLIVFTSTPRPLITIKGCDYFLVQDKEVLAILDADEAELEVTKLVSLDDIKKETATKVRRKKKEVK